MSGDKGLELPRDCGSTVHRVWTLVLLYGQEEGARLSSSHKGLWPGRHPVIADLLQTKADLGTDVPRHGPFPVGSPDPHVTARTPPPLVPSRRKTPTPLPLCTFEDHSSTVRRSKAKTCPRPVHNLVKPETPGAPGRRRSSVDVPPQGQVFDATSVSLVLSRHFVETQMTRLRRREPSRRWYPTQDRGTAVVSTRASTFEPVQNHDPEEAGAPGSHETSRSAVSDS